jgi:hypothetical protein
MKFRRALIGWVTAAIALLPLETATRAQQIMNANAVTIQTQYALVSASQTQAINTQTTLTIPAPPPSFYNYVCSVHFNASQNATSTAITNAVTTSTNFNAWAIKFSLAAVANQNYDMNQSWGIANVGCVKSTSPGTATTFVSPAAVAQAAFTWDATYYQAP